MRYALVILVLAGLAYPQTVDHGLGAFSNESGAILMAVDAALVNRDVKEPVRHVLRLPGLQGPEPRRQGRGQGRGHGLQGAGIPHAVPVRAPGQVPWRDPGHELLPQAGQGGDHLLLGAPLRLPRAVELLPPLTLNSPLAVREAYMLGQNGFMTPLYFKNPGFAKGDRLTIKVRDAKNPALTGECDVVLD
ncbi:MAG: hypothetical protein MZV64_12745 [Ignavibacteriales bacterium]|nr:hypothetical protein [Ignavibacteriales bacterium]